MNRYALSSEAERDLEQIRAYYEREAGVRIARYVLREITQGFELIADHPGIGHRRPDLTDEPAKFWQVFSYLIVYDPATQPLSIARVLHSAQDIAVILARPRAQ